jgi:hypothetical protein
LKDPTVEFVVLVTARGGICDLVCFSLWYWSYYYIREDRWFKWHSYFMHLARALPRKKVSKKWLLPKRSIWWALYNNNGEDLNCECRLL